MHGSQLWHYSGLGVTASVPQHRHGAIADVPPRRPGLQAGQRAVPDHELVVTAAETLHIIHSTKNTPRSAPAHHGRSGSAISAGEIDRTLWALLYHRRTGARTPLCLSGHAECAGATSTIQHSVLKACDCRNQIAFEQLRHKLAPGKRLFIEGW